MVYVQRCFLHPQPLKKSDLQGSYAGARAAHMRVLYPDLVYGAIASSGDLSSLPPFYTKSEGLTRLQVSPMPFFPCGNTWK